MVLCVSVTGLWSSPLPPNCPQLYTTTSYYAAWALKTSRQVLEGRVSSTGSKRRYKHHSLRVKCPVVSVLGGGCAVGQPPVHGGTGVTEGRAGFKQPATHGICAPVLFSNGLLPLPNCLFLERKSTRKALTQWKPR